MAKTATVTLGGRKYKLLPPGRDELKLLDAFVLKNRRSILQLAKDNLEGLAPELQQALLRDALRIEASRSADDVTAAEYGAVLDTRRGCAYLLWLMLKRTEPDMSLEEVERLVVEASNEEFERLLADRDELAEDDDGRGEQGGREPAADDAGGADAAG